MKHLTHTQVLLGFEPKSGGLKDDDDDEGNTDHDDDDDYTSIEPLPR